MTRERPGAVFVLGLVNVALGILSVFLGTAALGRRLVILVFQPSLGRERYVAYGMGKAPPVDQFPNVEAYLEAMLPGYTAGSALLEIEIVFAGLLLAAVGFGLLYMRPWARWGAVFYSLLTIGCQAASLLFQLALVMPLRQTYAREDIWYRSYSRSDWELNVMGAYFVLTSQFLFMTGHALAQLIVLVLPSVRPAFSATLRLPLPAETPISGNGRPAEARPTEGPAASLAGEAVSQPS